MIVLRIYPGFDRSNPFVVCEAKRMFSVLGAYIAIGACKS